MANKRALNAGKATIFMSLKDGAIGKKLNKLQGRFSSMGAGLARVGGMFAAAGAAILGPIAGAVKVFDSMGDSLDKASARTGASVEFLSAMGFAAEQTGSDVNTLEKSITKMQKSVFDGEKGLSTVTDALDVMGLTMDDIRGKSPEEQFAIFADAISKIKDPAIQAGAAMSIFGRGGSQILPLLKDGAAGIDAFKKEAKDLGIVIGSGDTTAAAEMHDAFNRLFKQIKAFTFFIGAAVGNQLTGLLDKTKALAAAAIQWAKDNRPLIVTIAKVGLAITAVGGLILGLGGFFAVAGIAVGGLTTVIGLVVSAIGFLLSPIGLAIAGIIAITAAFWDTITAAVKTSGIFQTLAPIVTKTFGAISSALADGEMSKAAEIFWAGLKLLWLEGTATLRGKWQEMTGAITRLWHEAVIGIAMLGVQAWGGITRTWEQATTGLMRLFNSFLGGVEKAWNSTVAFFQRTWLRIKGLFGQDVAGEIDALNAQLDRANKRVDQTTSGADKIISEDSQRRLQQSGKGETAIIDALAEDLNRRLKGADDGTKKAIADAKKQLDDARAAWSTATDAAEEAVVTAEENKKAAAEGFVPPDLGSVGSAASGNKANQTALFDARFASQIFGQGDGIQRKQLTAMEQTAEESKKTRVAIENGTGLQAVPG